MVSRADAVTFPMGFTGWGKLDRMQGLELRAYYVRALYPLLHRPHPIECS